MGVVLSDQLKWPTSFSDLSVYNVGCPPWNDGHVEQSGLMKPTKRQKMGVPHSLPNTLTIILKLEGTKAIILQSLTT